MGAPGFSFEHGPIEKDARHAGISSHEGRIEGYGVTRIQPMADELSEPEFFSADTVPETLDQRPIRNALLFRSMRHMGEMHADQMQSSRQEIAGQMLFFGKTAVAHENHLAERARESQAGSERGLVSSDIENNIGTLSSAARIAY
jgi:phosphoribosyl 1,2-cyclic phosphodiesterase